MDNPAGANVWAINLNAIWERRFGEPCSIPQHTVLRGWNQAGAKTGAHRCM